MVINSFHVKLIYFHICRDKNDIDSPISNSFDRLIRHHLGTAACGSLLVAFIEFIQCILSAVQVSLTALFFCNVHFNYLFHFSSLSINFSSPHETPALDSPETFRIFAVAVYLASNNV